MAAPVRTKKAAADEVFAIDYGADYLDAGETLISSTWTVPTGLTKVAESNTATVAKVLVSGGTVGEIYELVNDIETSTSPPRNPGECLRILITQC